MRHAWQFGLGLGCMLSLSMAANSANALVMTLDPKATSPVVLYPSGSEFTTDGGTGWANMGISLTGSTGTETSGAANFSAMGSINIDHFSNVVFLSGTKTGVGNDGNSWTFFTTFQITGSGTWSNGIFTAGTPTITLDLWGAQGGINVNNFGGSAVSSLASSLTDWANLGVQSPNLGCWNGSSYVGGGSQDCLLLAQTTGVLTGSSLVIDDSSQESKDTVEFNISTLLDSSLGIADGFFPSPDPSAFGLVVISGCASIVPVNISDKDTANFFGTVSSQSGNGPCNPSASGVDNNHDPVNWAFTADPNSVPEPGSLALLAGGLLGFRFFRRRKN